MWLQILVTKSSALLIWFTSLESLHQRHFAFLDLFEATHIQSSNLVFRHLEDLSQYLVAEVRCVPYLLDKFTEFQFDYVVNLLLCSCG